MVKIRFSRIGRTNRPVFTLVATHSRNARNGEYLEKLGQYDPYVDTEKALSSINVEAVKAWIGKGAQVTDTVKSLFKRNGIKL